MYNPKHTQFVGKHDYDKEMAENFANCAFKTFSVNIFQWAMKSNGKEMKPLKGIVRVYGSPADKEKVFAMAERIVNDLDNNQWDGRKTVSVK